MKRDRNNQFIKKLTTGMFLFVLSLSVMSVFNQKGNIALATEATELEHAITEDDKGAFIAIAYSGTEANSYINKDSEEAVPETPSTYPSWIFAGWYEEETCKTPIKKSVDDATTCYAKFVSETVLSVKCQTKVVAEATDDTVEKSNLRFVTSVDTTNYYRAGFEISREYQTTDEDGNTITAVKSYKNNETNTSYKRIVASLDSKVSFEYSPKVIDTKSETFITYTIRNIPSNNYGTEFLVKPYWITLDGAKVYGVSRYVAVNDNESSVVSIPVKVAAAEAYTAENFTINEVAKATDGTESLTEITGATVRYRANESYASIILSKQVNLKSATKYQVSGSGTATYVHRNLETVYTGINTEDTSWYTVYDEDTTKEYVIATAADLYGLAKLTTNTDGNKKTFAGKTIYVVSDIEANKGTASETSWSGETNYDWTPIGNSTYKFSGIFDGQMHTISAICDQTVSASYSGLFGYTADESLVSKFRLTNSYFYHGTTTDWLGYGSIVGCCEGDIDTVYSNANLNYAGDIRQIAGIAGRASGNGTTTGDVEITNCWFDGTIACGDATRQLGVGGVVGASNQATTLDITNCLNTGSITQTGETTADISFCIGGILGTDWGANCIITINNCLNAGSIATESTTAVGTIIGKITQKTATYSIDKTYCISGTAISNTIGAKNNAATITKNNITQKDADDVNGCVSYLNVSDLGFYGNSKTNEENEGKYWVAREEATNIKDGVPALKSFAEYIDVAWYYDTEDYDVGDNTFTIYTEEELFGFSEISQGYNFKDDIVQLGDDIEVNMGGDAKKWAAGTETPERQWKPIGWYTNNTSNNMFNGTFNGKDPKTGKIHTISGIHITSKDSGYVGFFSAIGADGEVKNFKLTNSYMYAQNTSTDNYKLAWGSVVGVAFGDIDTVYTDMYLHYDNGRQIGGIVGRIAGTEEQRITNCWSDGNMQLVGNSQLQQAGGIAGATNQNANVTFDNCLNTRNIVVTGTLKDNGRIAGIFGADNGASTVIIQNCLQAGTITDNSASVDQNYIGSIIGRMHNTKSRYTINNVYCKENAFSVVGSRNVTAVKEVIVPVDVANLNDENGFSYTTLDFKNTWAVRKDNVPGLQAFVDGEDINLDKARYDVRWYYDFANADANTYTINSEDELYGLAHLVNAGIETFVDEEGVKKTVQLGDDIVINAVKEDTVAKWESGEETPINVWTPIGTSDNKFAGVLDGKDSKTNELHTISGLYMYEAGANSGVFGATAAGSIVRNLKLDNSFIRSTGTATGSIVGLCYGNVDTVYSNAIVKGTGSCYQLGGIVGHARGSSAISNCWFGGRVQSGRTAATYEGGIVGAVSNSVSLLNCLNTGIVKSTVTDNTKTYYIGGIVGGQGYIGTANSVLTITDCMNIGTIDTKVSNYVGIVVGGIASKTGYTRQCTITDGYTVEVSCTDTDDITVSLETIGYYNTSDTGITVTDDTTVLADKSEYYGIEGYRWAKGLSFTDKWAARKDDVPALQSFVGDGLQIADEVLRYDTDWFYEGEPYEITNEEEFYGFTKLVSKGNKFTNQTVTLATDIDMNVGWVVGDGVPTNVWEPIGNNNTYQFEGSFDGQEHTIRGIYIDTTTQNVGLFGYVGGGSDATGSYAVLQDFALTNSYISSSNSRVASIAGCFSGDIYNVYSDATVKGNGQTGGFVGYYTAKYDGEIKDCWYKGNLTTNGQYGGGIVGRIGMGTKTIENCLFSGILNSTYSATNANGAAVGGLLGGIVPGNEDGQKYPTALVMNNNLSAGSVSGKPGQSGIGAIVGTINLYTKNDKTNTPTVTANSIYGITEDSPIGANPIGATLNVTSLHKADILGRKAYNQTGFDFENDWTAMAYDVPAPKNLENIAKDIAWLKLDTSWYRESPAAPTFEIDTVAELYGVSYLVNRGVDYFASQTISLTDNIKVNETSKAILSSWKVDGENEVVPVNEWIPIGTKASGKRFAGTFNGNGNAISGIYVSTDDNTGTYVGLFGSVNTTGVVQNLKLMDSYFSYNGTANSNENKELHLMMGSITAELRGCLQNVYSNAIIDSTASNVGGLVSRAVDTSTNEGEQVNILNCWFDGEVNLTGNARYSGGIVATTGGGNHLIDNCLNTGVISCERASGLYVGGILGTDYLAADGIEITNCLSAGTLTLSSTSYAGTIVGTVNKVTNVATDASGATVGHIGKYTITNSYATGQTTTSDASISRIGGKSGYTNEFAALREGITTVEAKEIEGRNAYSMSLDFENIWVARAYGVPGIKYLTSQEEQLLLDTTWYRTDESVSPYTLSTAAQLYGLGYLVNNGIDNFAGKEIVLGESGIVVNATEEGTVESWKDSKNAPVNEWIPIGIDLEGSRFAGTFNANSEKISGVYLDTTKSETYKGLFGATESGSSIRNLRLTDSYFNCSGAKAYMGSIVGDLRGDITNVYSNAIIGSRGDQTGGLIGQVNAISETVEITNCWYDGQLTSSKNEVGGLVARVAQGTVNVDNCLNTGIITSTYNDVNNIVGGICARVQGQTTVLSITDSIAAGKITDVGYGKNVKSVVGYMQGSTVNFDNMFATKSAYGRALPSEGTLTVDETTSYKGVYNGTVIRTHKANRLIGYCVGEVKTGETAPKLDFTADWTIRTSDVPVPTCFADLVTPVMVAEGSTLDATLNTQIGLDTLGLSIVNAIDMGEGNYVLETTVDDTAYSNYVAKIEGELGFGEPVAENSAGAGADGVHSISYKKQNPDWVLTLTYVEATDVLTISINTDTDSLSDNLVYTEGVEDENYKATGDITFSMLQMKEYTVDDQGKEIPVDAIYADLYLPKYLWNENSYWYGNSFVFQLPNGHFIVNDGGARQEFADLVTYLKTAARTTEDGQNPVYIDAWIVSHQHGDHFDVIRAASDALRDETSNLMDNIYVDAFYINEPNAKVLANASLDDDVDSQYNGMTLFTKGPDGEQADIYRMQTGQRYYFNGLVMDVIQAQEQIPYSKYAKFNASSSDPDFNTASTVTLFTTSNQQKILIGGDANYANMQYIMDAYGIENDYTKATLLKNINIFVAFHHGKNMSMNINGTVDYSFIDYLTKDGSETGHLFDYVLYPCSLVYGDNSDPVYAFPNAEEANAYLNTKVKNNNYKHYGDGNVVITLSGVTTE